MKNVCVIFFLFLLSCNSSRRSSGISNWSNNPTDKTSIIKVTSSFYNGYEGLHSRCIDILNGLHFEIDDSRNPITTKPRMIFNGVHARYFIQCDNNSITIWGQYVATSIGGSGDINSSIINWQSIIKGKNRFGTPSYEKMTVMAEAVKNATIQYSER